MHDSEPDQNQRRRTEVLRWFCVLPVAFLASWLLGGTGVLFLSQIGLDRQGSSVRPQYPTSGICKFERPDPVDSLFYGVARLGEWISGAGSGLHETLQRCEISHAVHSASSGHGTCSGSRTQFAGLRN